MSNSEESKSEIVRCVHSALQEAKLRRGSYSIRQFARKIGIAAPILVQVLNGKRNLTRKLATQILAGMRVESDEINRLVSALPEKQIRRSRKSSSGLGEKGMAIQFSELAASELAVLSEWWYFAILSLAEISSFRSDAKWIARSIGIPFRDAERAVERLLKLGLLTRDAERRLVPTGTSLTTTFDVPSVYIRKNHVQGLDLAAERIGEVPLEQRDYSSVTLAVDRSRLAEAKKRIEKFRRELTSFLEGGAKEDVYRFQLQLFPLTKKPLKKKGTKK